MLRCSNAFLSPWHYGNRAEHEPGRTFPRPDEFRPTRTGPNTSAAPATASLTESEPNISEAGNAAPYTSRAEHLPAADVRRAHRAEWALHGEWYLFTDQFMRMMKPPIY